MLEVKNAKLKRGRPKKKAAATTIKQLTRMSKVMQLVRAMCMAMIFTRVLDLDEWSDEYRVLPSETSSEHGQWHTSRFPFLRRIMKTMSPSSIAREIVGVKGAQLGFTELGINWILYSAHCHPGPMGYVQKTDEDIKDFSKQKLTPSINACDAVYYTLGEGKSKRYANSYKNKAYPGGFVRLGPANSTGFLKSKSWGKAFMDEEDEYDLNINNQGSPKKILEKRMVNFPGHKLVRVSTPVTEELSTIQPGYEAGSMEQFYVPCPYCNPQGDQDEYMFLIEWETIKWGDTRDGLTGDPSDVWCECPRCAGKIYENDYKTWMLDNGDWYSTKDPDDPENKLPRYKVGDVPNPSFRIPSFYSPLGFFSWTDAVHDWFEYLKTKDVNLLQVFINQTCAQTFSLTGSDINTAGLLNRREMYSGDGSFDVPAGGLCLTAGVDIQNDRIEVEVVAWGMLDENWSIDYKVIPGDTSQMGDKRLMLPNGQPSVWRLLDEYLYKTFKHETGEQLSVEMTLIDTGHRSHNVHLFCRPREGRRIYPCKGKSGWGEGYYRRAKRRHEKFKTFDYLVFVDELKNKVYSMLTIDDVGPSFCHFPLNPAYDEKHFKGLTCERLKTRMVRGRKTLYWDCPEGARNEPLDCRDYALAARVAYSVNMEQRAAKGVSVKPVRNVRRVVRRRGSPGL